MSKISEQPTNEDLVKEDILPVVDISDDSQAASGTNKKVTVEQLLALLKNGGFDLTQDDIQDGIDKVGYTPAEQTKLAGLSNNVNINPFVKPGHDQYGKPCFTLKGQPLQVIGFNWYPLLVPTTTSPQRQAILDGIRRVGGNLLRSWCFDSPDAFRSLTFPLGPSNLITNPDFETDTFGWTLPGTVTRSTDQAHAGTHSLKMSQGLNSYDVSYTQVTVTPNTQYVWTMYYMASQITGSQFQQLPRQIIGTTPDGAEIANAGILPSASVMTKRQVVFNSGNNTSLYLAIQNWGAQDLCYFDDMDCSVKQTPVLVYNEASFVRLDQALDEMRKRGIKVILSLADGNESNFNTKGTYVNWANAVFNAGLSTAYPYIAFYQSAICKQLYKDFIDVITQRVNTVNGIIYKNDPTIFSWELGNELRINQFTSESGTQNSANSQNVALMVAWATEMAEHIKVQDPNHMVNFGDMGHTWRFVSGDTVMNGSGYGVDYRKLTAIDAIDFLDFHMYPTQDAQNSANYPTGETDITSYGLFFTGHAPPIKQSSGSVTSFHVTLNEAAQIGDVVVVHLVFSSALTPAPTLTDNVGNTYSLTSSAVDNKTHHYQSTHTIAGATSLNVSWSGSRTVTAYVDEISGRDNGNNARTRAGLEAQIADYIAAAHENDKPVLVGEVGWATGVVRNNYHYPLYPRLNAFNAFFQAFLNAGGDAIAIWHAVANETSGSFDIALYAHGGEAVVDDTDDTNTVALIKKYNGKLAGDILTANNELTTAYRAITPRPNTLATSGTIAVDPTISDIIKQTPAGASTFNASSVGPAGTVLSFIITTSGTSSYTLTFGTNFKSTGTLATGTSSGKVFAVSFKSDGTNWVETSRTTAM